MDHFLQRNRKRGKTRLDLYALIASHALAQTQGQRPTTLQRAGNVDFQDSADLTRRDTQPIRRAFSQKQIVLGV